MNLRIVQMSALLAFLIVLQIILVQPGLGYTPVQAGTVTLSGTVLGFLPKAVHPAVGVSYAGSEQLSIAISISLRDPNGLEALIQQQNDRHSAMFRHWLTPEQIADQFGQSQATYDAVAAWLTSQGLTVTQKFSDRLLIMATGTAAAAASAFHVNFNSFSYDNQWFIATTIEPQIPIQFSGVISSITGLDTYHGLTANHAFRNTFTTAGVSPNTLSPPYTPTNYRTAYRLPVADGFDGGPTAGSSAVNLGIASACYANLADLNGFASTYSLPTFVSGTNIIYVPVNSNSSGLTPPIDQEPTLDIEWSHAVAPGAITYFYYDNGVTSCGSGARWTFSGMIAAVNKIVSDNLVATWSMSWGCSEQPTECWPTASLDSMTGFVSSGDCGAYNCDKPTLAVEFPSIDPNVVSVGGTTLTINNDGTYNSESGLYCPSCTSEGWGGGGGVSTIFSKPSYQSGVPALGSVTNRAGPDVSLDMDFHYLIYYGGSLQGCCWGGTSFAAPEWNGWLASMIGFAEYATEGYSTGTGGVYERFGQIQYPLYDYAAQKTEPGELALWLRSSQDVTTGANGYVTSCGGSGQPQCGYSAVAGFDEATGWGSMIGDLLTYTITNWYAPEFVHAIAGSSNGYMNALDASFSSFSSPTFAFGYVGALAIQSVSSSAPIHPTVGGDAYLRVAVGSGGGWVNVYYDDLPYVNVGGPVAPTWYTNVCSLPGNCAVTSVAMSDDGSTLAVGSDNGYLNVYNATNGRLLGFSYTGTRINQVAISFNGGEIVTAGNGGWVNKYHVTAGIFGGPDWFSNTGGNAVSIATAHNGDGNVVVGSDNGYVNFYDNTGANKGFYYTGGAVNSVDCSGGCVGIAAASANGYVNSWTSFPTGAGVYPATWYLYTCGATACQATSVDMMWNAPYQASVVTVGNSQGWVNTMRAVSGSLLWYSNVGGSVASVSISSKQAGGGSGQPVGGFTIVVGSNNGWINDYFYLSGIPIWYFYTGSSVAQVSVTGI